MNPIFSFIIDDVEYRVFHGLIVTANGIILKGLRSDIKNIVNDKIREYYDLNINLTMDEFCIMIGISRSKLKSILMA